MQPTQSARKGGGAARILGLLSLVSGLLAIVLIVLGVVGMARTATPNMQGFNPGATVTVSSSGASIYARSDADRTQTVCTARDGGNATTLERPTSEFAVEVSGSDFYEVARTPESLTPGSYELACDGTTQGLYVGPAAPTTSASGLLGPVSIISGVVLALLALGLGLLAVLVRGSRRKPASGNAGYPQDSGVAQPGYTSPYANAPAPGSQPYGPPSQQGPYGQPPEQNYYGQPPSGAPAYTAPSEPTQAIAYGDGHYTSPAQPSEKGDDEAVYNDAHASGDESEDQQSESPPKTEQDDNVGTPYPPPPPPR